MKVWTAIGLLAACASASCTATAQHEQIAIPEGRLEVSLARGDALAARGDPLADGCGEAFPGDLADICIQTRPGAADEIVRFYTKQFEQYGWKPVGDAYHFGPGKVVTLAPPSGIIDVQRACIRYGPVFSDWGTWWSVDITLSSRLDACDPIP